MKSRTLIIGGVILLLLLGGGVFAFMQMNKSQAPTNEQSVAEQNTETKTETSQKSSIQSLLTAGKNVTCTLTYPDGNGEGMVYVAGNKVRGDFTVKVNETPMLTHMIQDGSGYIYMWSDADKTGTKFKLDPNAPKPSVSPGAQTQTADLDKEVDLKCNNWAVETSKFSVPTDVKFTDMSQLMNNAIKQSGSAMPKVDSSVCDQITDPTAKASCLKSLGN